MDLKLEYQKVRIWLWSVVLNLLEGWSMDSKSNSFVSPSANCKLLCKSTGFGGGKTRRRVGFGNDIGGLKGLERNRWLARKRLRVLLGVLVVEK